MPRPARPEDLYRFRIPTDPHLSPDGARVAFTVQVVTPDRAGYRHAIWIAPADGSAPARQLTIGAKHDRQPRFSPDGRVLAFLSDRRPLVEERSTGAGAGPAAGSGGEDGEARDDEDAVQVHLLPLDGGEARRLTDLPRGVEAFAWSPDGRRLVVLSASRGATADEEARLGGVERQPRPGAPRRPDFRYIDRLQYMENGKGFTYDRVAHLWLVDVETGQVRRLTDGPTPDEAPAWSPDSGRIAFAANRRRDHDLVWHSDIHVVEVATGELTAITGGALAFFWAPEWLPDGRTIAALGHRYPAAGGSRNDIWLFAADGSDAHSRGGRNLSASHDLMPGASMNSDLTVGEPARLAVSADGRGLTFSAPIEGSCELWRISVEDGALERLTEGRHYLSAFDQRSIAGGQRIAYLRSSPTELPEAWVVDVAGPGGSPSPRRVSALNDEALAGIELGEPVERWVRSDGWRIQGWYLPPRGEPGGGRGEPGGGRGGPAEGAGGRSGGPASGPTGGPPPLVTEIHGGPHTLYGYAPGWEFQVLAGAGIGVWYANPRGSEGYGEAFNAANFRDWGDGPMRDVLAGVDALVGEGLADPTRLGLTGGSYGGYLTNWIVARDDRFRAALTCRSVSDLSMLMLTGDISGPEFGRLEFGAAPWEDPDLYRELSPITHARRIRTPLLIQHAERDLRTTIGQAEALFTVLRSSRRPVRLMRVPGETHELTRSGTPFRRAENLVQVRDWFVHFLVKGRRTLPPVPRQRAGNEPRAGVS